MLDEMATRGTPEYLVAAKTVLDPVKTPEGATELVAEATVMMQVVGHPNLVSIIGVVTAGDPLVLVLQLCEHGSVLSYSKKKFADDSRRRLWAKPWCKQRDRRERRLLQELVGGVPSALDKPRGDGDLKVLAGKRCVELWDRRGRNAPRR